MLTRGKRESQCRADPPIACRSRPPQGTRLAGSRELIPVPAIGFESGNFDVNRVRQLGRGDCGAASHDFGHLLVGSHLPRHFDVLRRHSAAGQRLRSQSGPQHEAVGRGFARSHAQFEWVISPGNPPPQNALGLPGQQWPGREPAPPAVRKARRLQLRPAVDSRRGAFIHQVSTTSRPMFTPKNKTPRDGKQPTAIRRAYLHVQGRVAHPRQTQRTEGGLRPGRRGDKSSGLRNRIAGGYDAAAVARLSVALAGLHPTRDGSYSHRRQPGTGR